MLIILTVVVGAKKTELDAPSEIDSEAEKAEMESAEKTQKEAIKEHKRKKKEREVQDQLRKQYSECGVIFLSAFLHSGIHLYF